MKKKARKKIKQEKKKKNLEKGEQREKQSPSEAAPQKTTRNALNCMVYRNSSQRREIKF